MQLSSIKRKSSDFTLKILLWLTPAVSGALIAALYSTLPEKVPLFYSLPWGNNQLAEKVMLFLIPVIMMLINISNSAMSVFIKRIGDEYLMKVMLISCLTCNLLAFIGLVQIIRIIT
jgi:uncharacterized membrane protein